MSRACAPTAILHMPDSPGGAVLRAGLTAMRIPGEPRDRDTALRRLAEGTNCVLFIDISRAARSTSPTLLQLDSLLPRGECRKRVFLTRLVDGHVSPSDRQWAASLGFAHFYSEFDAADCEGTLRSALDAVAGTFSMSPADSGELQRYVRALGQDRPAASPRALIRAVTDLSAEALATLLAESLDIQDRTYRLQTYSQCFVGSEAVAWIARRYRIPKQEAVAVGQALGTLGLLAHVVQEHPFRDENLFYRMAISPVVDRLDMGELWRSLRGGQGVRLADRSYLGTIYPRCWIGAEAVANLCARHGLTRHAAWVVLHRLMQLNLVEHVTHDRPFIDGTFFYRFAGLPPKGVSS